MDMHDWAFFAVKELFTRSRGRISSVTDEVSGETPFVGASAKNNGVTARIARADFDGPAITVSANGSIAEAFYQEAAFSASSDVNVLRPLGWELTRERALFLATLIRQEKWRYSYGRKMTGTKLPDTKLLLPTTPEGAVDWTQIDQFMASLPEYEDSLSVSDEALEEPISFRTTGEWEGYILGDILERIDSRPYHLNALEQDVTGVEYISRTGRNNGLTAYVSPPASAEVIPGDTISVALGGTVLSTFYRPVPWLHGDHIAAVKPRNWTMTPARGIFLARLIREEAWRFSYGRQANTSLMKLKVKLPSLDGAPDWEWIDQFMSGLPYSKVALVA